MVKDDIFIGLWIPEEVNSFLTLYTLDKGISKSKLVRDMILSWESDTSCKGQKIQSLISNIARKYQNEWLAKKTTLPQALHENAFGIFKYELKAKLIGKVEEKHVLKIIDSVKL